MTLQTRKTLLTLNIMENTETRVFFVVDSKDDNEEIYTSLEEANLAFDKLKGREGKRLYIAYVRNSYFTIDGRNGKWNYDDHSDTFNIIRIIRE